MESHSEISNYDPKENDLDSIRDEGDVMETEIDPKKPPARQSSGHTEFSDMPRNGIPMLLHEGYSQPEITPQRSTSQHTNSSTCRQLPIESAQEAQAPSGESLSPTSPPPTVRVEVESQAPSSHEADLRGLGAHMMLPDDHLLPQLPDPDLTSYTKLEEGLQEAIENAHTNNPYVPIDAQFRLLTKEAIKEQLEHIARRHPKIHIEGQLDYWASKIFDRVEYTESGCKGKKPTTTRRIIFAILVLAGFPERIFKFIGENLYDKDLPFDCHYATPPGANLGPDGVFKSLTKVNAFEKWPKLHLRTFYNHQWYFTAPYFNMQQGKVRFYPLRDMVPLPFLFTDSKKEVVAGGFGQVCQVQIDPAHHNYQHPETSEADNRSSNRPKLFFAVKKLIYPRSKDTCQDEEKRLFDFEVDALKRFTNEAKNKHLIKLLATYYHQGHYNLIFPWADGNLREYWDGTEAPEHTYQNLLWIADQVAGLTEALKMLHNNEFGVNYDPDSLSTPPAETARHGDIKPANILFFKTKDGIVLKLSDFGLTRFHRKVSEIRMYEKLVGSRTYRAPEIDLKRGVSRMYDMWALGCVFLEFLSWYVYGCEDGVEQFSVQRVKEDYQKTMKQDSFFNVAVNDAGAKFGAFLKPCVISRIQALYASEYATRFIWDFLELINESLLRIRVEKRIDSVQAFKRLDKWRKKCQSNPGYCIDLPPPEDREMKKRLTNESDNMDKNPVLMDYPQKVEGRNGRRGSMVLSRTTTLEITTAAASEPSDLQATASPPASPRSSGNPKRRSAHDSVRPLPSPVREETRESSVGRTLKTNATLPTDGSAPGTEPTETLETDEGSNNASVQYPQNGCGAGTLPSAEKDDPGPDTPKQWERQGCKIANNVLNEDSKSEKQRESDGAAKKQRWTMKLGLPRLGEFKSDSTQTGSSEMSGVVTINCNGVTEKDGQGESKLESFVAYFRLLFRRQGSGGRERTYA